VTAPTRLEPARKTRTVYSGGHLLEPTVDHFPCERIEPTLGDETAAAGFLLDVDGEPLDSLPLAVEVVLRALRVRA
jgi:diacylglycerol kinase family enzyme